MEAAPPSAGGNSDNIPSDAGSIVSNRFLEKLQEKKKALETENPAPILDPRYIEDIPDIDDTPTPPHVTPEQQALDDFIRLLPITEAYNRWTNKPNKTPIKDFSRTEIKVSCPNPQHADKNPSCSLNTKKNVFMCFQCGGGDIWDIAAWGKGYPVPGYKNNPQMFRNLREEIGRDYGIEVVRGIAGDEYLVTTGPANTSSSVPSDPVGASPPGATPPTPPAQQQATVIYTPSGSEYAEEQLERELLSKRVYPDVPWRKLVPENTFLREYLNATTIDDVPEEFHFWSGLIALSMAVGRMRVLEDSPEVIGNLFVCFTSGTGTGKSKAKRHLVNVIKDSLPYKKDDQPPFGTHIIKGSQSGEFIVKSFIHPILDSAGKQIGYWPAVRGLIDFEELAEIVAKSKRQGSTLKQVIMNLYDAPRLLSSGSLTHGNIEAEYPVASVITTTQLKSVRELISRTDDSSGFANRWIYATGVPKPQFAVNRAVIDTTRASGLLRLINADSRAPETITWNQDAENTWVDFFRKTIIPFKENNPDAEIAQRIDLLLKKLFLLFSVNQREKTLNYRTVESVLKLYPHLMETFQIIDEQISSTVEGDNQELILRHIARMTGQYRGPTASELHRVLKRRIPQVRFLRKMLEDLTVLGVIQEHKVPAGPAGGRPTTCYTLATSPLGVTYNVRN